MVKFNRLMACAALTTFLGASLSGCASIKIPDFDFIKFPEFKEEATNIPDYPSVANAPALPTGIRSDAAWDQAARNALAKRDELVVPADVDALTEEETLQAIQKLSAEVDEYKKDDPQ